MQAIELVTTVYASTMKFYVKETYDAETDTLEWRYLDETVTFKKRLETKTTTLYTTLLQFTAGMLVQHQSVHPIGVAFDSNFRLPF